MRALILAICLFATPSYALCAHDPGAIADMLGRAQNPEYTVAQGIDVNGQLHTMFANEKTGDWTVAITNLETGITCIATAGKGWRKVEPQKPDY